MTDNFERVMHAALVDPCGEKAGYRYPSKVGQPEYDFLYANVLNVHHQRTKSFKDEKYGGTWYLG